MAFQIGVGLSAAELAPGTIPGTYGSAYYFPQQSDLQYFATKGLSVGEGQAQGEVMASRMKAFRVDHGARRLEERIHHG